MVSVSKWFALTSAVLGLVAGAANQARADIVITVTPSLAPNAYGSPSYAGYVSNAITALEKGLSSYGTPDTPSYYQALTNGSAISANQNVVTGFYSWLGQTDPGTVFGPAFAQELGNRLLFGLSIVGTTNADKFSISNLSFTETSSDPGNTLGFSFGAGSYNYSSEYVGVIYGAGGAGDVADYTYVTSGPNTQLVNAVFGRGSGNAYSAYSTDPGATDQDRLNNAIGSISNETFSGMYTLGGVTGSGTIGIQAVPEPAPIALIVASAPFGLGYWMIRRRKPAAV